MEFFKHLALGSGGEENEDTLAISFPHYNQLKFLIPYCEQYREYGVVWGSVSLQASLTSTFKIKIGEKKEALLHWSRERGG